MENKRPGEVPSLTPLPDNFSAVFVVSTDELQSLNTLTPFTQQWADFWAGLADKFGDRNLLESFEKRGALENLEAVAKKCADPNLILLLFVKYLWLSENAVKTYERNEPLLKINQVLLHAVRNVHFYYEEFYKKPLLPSFAYRKDLVLSGEPSSEVERFLTDAEQKIHAFLNSRDHPKEGMRSPPKDKINRVIFAIHHHIKEKTGGPQWSDFLELLLAADAIKRNIKKKKTPYAVVEDNPGSRIFSHLDSFEKHHSEEAKTIATIMARPLSQLLFVPPHRA